MQLYFCGRWEKTKEQTLLVFPHNTLPVKPIPADKA